MTFLDSILRDLRERKLWPVAVALVLALIAVPVVLSKSGAAATPPPVSPPLAATASSATAVPAVSVSTSPLHSRLRGHARDPFTQPKQKAAAQKVATTPSAATKPATTPTTGTQTTTTSTSTTGGTTPTSTSTGTGGSGAGSGSGSTTPTFPTTPHKPAPTGLSPTQSYDVALGITNSAGGLDTSDPLERLSILPNNQEPLLVELGVLKGGHRVLFAVEPQTRLSGPGKCTPGPVDCEILSLASGQIEQLSMSTPTGTVDVAKFAVTDISADRHPSVAAADQARRMESAAGRRLLNQSNLSALSLFAYRPSAGAVVDLRNLSVGGN
jgi:hypothetical protein